MFQCLCIHNNIIYTPIIGRGYMQWDELRTHCVSSYDGGYREH